MPLSFEGFSNTVVVTPPSTLTPTTPGGTLAGDLSIVHISGDVSAPIAPFPVGWTEIPITTETAVVHRLWQKTLAFPGETGTWTFANFGAGFTQIGVNAIFRGQTGAIPNAFAEANNLVVAVWTYPAIVLPVGNCGVLLYTATGIVADSLINFLPVPTVNRYTTQIIVAGGSITLQLQTIGTLLTFGQQGPGGQGPWTADTMSGLPRSGSVRTLGIAGVPPPSPLRGKAKKMGGSGIGVPFVR